MRSNFPVQVRRHPRHRTRISIHPLTVKLRYLSVTLTAQLPPPVPMSRTFLPSSRSGDQNKQFCCWEFNMHITMGIPAMVSRACLSFGVQYWRALVKRRRWYIIVFLGIDARGGFEVTTCAIDALGFSPVVVVVEGQVVHCQLFHLAIMAVVLVCFHWIFVGCPRYLNRAVLWYLCLIERDNI